MSNRPRDEKEIKQHLTEYLRDHLPDTWTIFEKEHNTIQIIHRINRDQGITLQLEDTIRRIEQEPARMQEWLLDLSHRINAVIQVKDNPLQLKGNESAIFPVLRNPSGNEFMKRGSKLISRGHTTESVIVYALDLKTSYVLIHDQLLKESGWTEAELHKMAIDNLEKLDVTPRMDQVGGNIFHFISHSDGYAASRVLNRSLLETMAGKVKGEFGVAFPHQDVLIFADLIDKRGFQVLSEVTMDFAVRGEIPISSIPFTYEEGQLEPFLTIRTK